MPCVLVKLAQHTFVCITFIHKFVTKLRSIANMDDISGTKIDLNELESRLYSQIHHDIQDIDHKQQANESNLPLTNPDTPKPKKMMAMQNSQHHQAVESSSASPRDLNNSENLIQPSNNLPKPFTQYTSYLSQVGSPPLDGKSHNINKKQKFHKEKSLNANKEKRLLNPFCRLNVVKQERVEKLKKKQQQANQIRQRNALKKKPSVVSVSSSDSDDDVIILPTKPTPVYSIQSSDDENPMDDNNKLVKAVSPIPSNASDDYIEPNERKRVSQCDDALGGIDDFELDMIEKTIEKIQNTVVCDLDADTEMTSNEAAQSDEIQINFSNAESLDDTMNNSETKTSAKLSSVQEPVFAKPSTSKMLAATECYEVADNSFAAVDVYESESSDMPDTIYTRGQKKKEPKSNSESECNDVVLKVEDRLKRLKKRRASSSTKGSDHNDGGNSDDDSDVRLSPVKVANATSSRGIVRGDAVANAVTDTRKMPKTKSRKRKKVDSAEYHSDEEFISMLSTVVHSEFDEYKEIVGGPQKPISPIAKTSDWTVSESSEPIRDTPSSSRGNNLTVVENGADPNGEDIQLNTVKTTMNRQTAGDLQATFDDSKRTNIVDKIKGKSVVSCSLGVDPEIGWNDEMKCFYNKSWGGESHDTFAIQRAMSSN